MNYFEFYCGDYARDTAELTLAQHGAYVLLLSTYYAKEKPLPADWPTLFRIARAMTEDEQAAVRLVADTHFPVNDEDGLRHNPRVDEEIEKAQGRMERSRLNGKKGGRPKKTQQQPKKNPPGYLQGAQKEPGAKAPHTPHASSTRTSTGGDSPDLTRTPAHASGESGGTVLEGQFEGHELIGDDGTRLRLAGLTPVAEAAITLRRLGLSVTGMNPDLIAFIEEGGTLKHLLEQHAAYPDKPIKYLCTAARNELASKAATVTGTPSARHTPSKQRGAIERARQRFMQPEDATDGDDTTARLVHQPDL